MKITLNVYVNPQPGQTMDDLMKIPVTIAEAFAEILNEPKFQHLKSFDVSCDTTKTRENSKTCGVPYELLKNLNGKKK